MAPAPARWWSQIVKREPRAPGCYTTKTAALQAFIEANRRLIDEYGGVDYRVGASEFDAVNHKHGAKARTIAEALWAAMPAGKPFCLDRIDLDALNDTSPARQRDDARFELPDDVYVDTVARDEYAHYAAQPDDTPFEEFSPSVEPNELPWEPTDDPSARAYVERADDAGHAYAAAARAARYRRRRARPARAKTVKHELEPKPKPKTKTRTKTMPKTKSRSKRGARIDDSHQPFKRLRVIGPGPKRHPPVDNVKDWECRKGSKKYEQICVYVGPNLDRRGKTTKNRMNPKKKKKYNKLYRAWVKKTRGTATATKRARPGYKCRRTKSTKCR